MKRTILAVVVTAVVAPMAHASNVDVMNFVKGTMNMANLEFAMGRFSSMQTQENRDSLEAQHTELHNAFENLNARDRMVVKDLADKFVYPGLGADVTGNIKKIAAEDYHPANVPANWDQDKTQAFIDAAHGIQQPSSAPVAPVVDVQISPEQMIKDNMKQVVKLAMAEQPGSPVYIAMQQKLTELGNQLKDLNPVTLKADGPQVSPSAPATDIAVHVQNDEQDYLDATETAKQEAKAQARNDALDAKEALQDKKDKAADHPTIVAPTLTPAKPDDRTGKMAFNQQAVDQIALTTVKYDSANKPEVNPVDEPAQPEQAQEPREVKDIVTASTLTPATKPADKPQEAKETIPASTLTPATKPAQKPAETAAEPVKTPVVNPTKEEAPASTQVVNHYTIAGMSPQQAAQQQDNTDQILSHSRAIASNREAIQQNSQKIDRLQSQQDTDRKAAKAGTANALAVSGLHYVDTDNSIAIGAGTYEGQNAGSIGYRHKFSQNVAATIAASQDSNGGTGAAASLAVGW
ncbi:YadA-like family protein [Salmonella enterica]|nr:YadA-like family protein [Salmonella enterica]